MDKPILVFDSGIGGLSILRHLTSLQVPLIYFADQANFPYGDKDPSWVQARLLELSANFLQYNPRAVVIACNTATTTTIPSLRETLSCPVIGVEPVVKPISQYPDAVIWGTTVTLSSSRAQDLKLLHGSHIRYYTPHGLASAVEYQDKSKITKILTKAKEDLDNPSAIGLSCTHYPLIKSQIQSFFPNSQIIDPSAAVASQVRTVLNLTPSSTNTKAKIEYVTTHNLLELKRISKKYI